MFDDESPVSDGLDNPSGEESEALPQSAPETIGTTEASPIPSPDGATTPEVPAVDVDALQRQLEEKNRIIERSNQAYRQQEAIRRQQEQQLANLESQRQAREQAELNALMQDKEKWYEVLNDPMKLQEFNSRTTQLQIAQAMNQVRYEQQAQETAREATAAFKELDEFRTKAGLDDATFQGILTEYNGFAAYPPQTALQLAKDVITGRHVPKMAKQMTALATKNAEEQAAKKQKQQLPTPGTVATGDGQADERVEFMQRLIKAKD